MSDLFQRRSPRHYKQISDKKFWITDTIAQFNREYQRQAEKAMKELAGRYDFDLKSGQVFFDGKKIKKKKASSLTRALYKDLLNIITAS